MRGKTEREKMLAGEFYFPQDTELAAVRLRAHRLTSAPDSSKKSWVAPERTWR